MSSENELRHATSKKSDGKHEFSHTTKAPYLVVLLQRSISCSDFLSSLSLMQSTLLLILLTKMWLKMLEGKCWLLMVLVAAARSSMSYTSQNVFGWNVLRTIHLWMDLLTPSFLYRLFHFHSSEKQFGHWSHSTLIQIPSKKRINFCCHIFTGSFYDWHKTMLD